jgi:hypothetical protein
MHTLAAKWSAKLYLNYNAAVRKNWEENKATNISKANLPNCAGQATAATVAL